MTFKRELTPSSTVRRVKIDLSTIPFGQAFRIAAAGEEVYGLFVNDLTTEMLPSYQFEFGSGSAAINFNGIGQGFRFKKPETLGIFLRAKLHTSSNLPQFLNPPFGALVEIVYFTDPEIMDVVVRETDPWLNALPFAGSLDRTAAGAKFPELWIANTGVGLGVNLVNGFVAKPIYGRITALFISSSVAQFVGVLASTGWTPAFFNGLNPGIQGDWSACRRISWDTPEISQLQAFANDANAARGVAAPNTIPVSLPAGGVVEVECDFELAPPHDDTHLNALVVFGTVAASRITVGVYSDERDLETF